MDGYGEYEDSNQDGRQDYQIPENQTAEETAAVPLMPAAVEEDLSPENQSAAQQMADALSQGIRTEAPANAIVQEPVASSSIEDEKQDDDIPSDETNEVPQAGPPPPSAPAMDGRDESPIDANLDARLSSHRQKVRRIAAKAHGDDALRQFLILPLVAVLGYDMFDPSEVLPGYAAEGLKVDYAILSDDEPRVLIALAHNPEDTNTAIASRLGVCMAATGAICGILTDGLTARVHGLDADGMIEDRPLFSLDLQADGITPPALHALTRAAWDPDGFKALSGRARLRDSIRDSILEVLGDPTSALVEFIGRHMIDNGHVLGPRAADDIRDVAVEISRSYTEPVIVIQQDDATQEIESQDDDRPMMPAEREAYRTIVSICEPHVNKSRIYARPAKSYCAVLLDDSNRRTIARIHFNAARAKYIGTFVGKDETRVQIADVDAIEGLEDKIVGRLQELDPASFR